MYVYPVRPDEIYHYGMPRRSGRYPWGSGDRPYQRAERKDIKRALSGKDRGTTLRKDHKVPSGTILYRTSSNPNENKKNIYVTYQTPDRDLYRGGYIKNRDKSSKAYEYKMVAKRDINVAGEDSIKEALKESLKKNPKLLNESVNAYLNMLFPKGSLDRYYIEYDDYDNPIKDAWDNFVERSIKDRKNQTIEDTYGALMISLGMSKELKKSVSVHLKNKGFDAMTDEAGVGGKRIGNVIEGVDPLIVFNQSEVFKDIDVREISRNEERKAQKDYTKWVKKARPGSSIKNW